MASFSVEFVKSSRKEFDRLPAKMKTTTAEALKLLSHNPYSELLKIKKLKGADHLYRIRLGDYRVVYEIRQDKARRSRYQDRPSQRSVSAVLADRNPTLGSVSIYECETTLAFHVVTISRQPNLLLFRRSRDWGERQCWMVFIVLAFLYWAVCLEQFAFF